MKTLLTSLFALGLTLNCFAQSSSMAMNEVKLDAVTLTPAKNVHYTNLVVSNNNSTKITNLEKKVASFDVTTSSAFKYDAISKFSVFKNNFETYEVLFKNVAGNIVATYDADGELMNTFEKFENIPLPIDVSNAIHNEYPGWTINSSVYRVNYFGENNEVKKVYNIQISNRNEKLNLKVSPDGIILNQKVK